MPLELMPFDKNEIGLIEKSPSGRSILVATCTGPNSEINAKRLSIAFDLIELIKEATYTVKPTSLEETILMNNLINLVKDMP